MHLLCKFHMRTCFPWQVIMALKPFISKLLMCNLEWFSKIQLQIKRHLIKMHTSWVFSQRVTYVDILSYMTKNLLNLDTCK